MDVSVENDRPSVATEVARLWTQILRVDRVNPSDSFFECGGNSLMAMKFLVEIETLYGPEALTPEQLYAAPTCAEITAAIEPHVR